MNMGLNIFTIAFLALAMIVCKIIRRIEESYRIRQARKQLQLDRIKRSEEQIENARRISELREKSMHMHYAHPHSSDPKQPLI